MRKISLFSSVSGLGLNLDKTALLSSLPNLFDPAEIADCPWPDVKVVSEYKHLGVVIGPKVRTERIFRSAHRKALDRLQSMSPTIKRLPIHKRISLVNTYITPIYLYLGAFFVIPYELTREFRA